MKVELVKPEVEPDVQITMSRDEAKVLRQRLSLVTLHSFYESAESLGLSERVGEKVNDLFYKLTDILF